MPCVGSSFKPPVLTTITATVAYVTAVAGLLTVVVCTTLAIVLSPIGLLPLIIAAVAGLLAIPASCRIMMHYLARSLFNAISSYFKPPLHETIVMHVACVTMAVGLLTTIACATLAVVLFPAGLLPLTIIGAVGLLAIPASCSMIWLYFEIDHSIFMRRFCRSSGFN
jgi:hypothetical protein